jgi:hypothetical protein
MSMMVRLSEGGRRKVIAAYPFLKLGRSLSLIPRKSTGCHSVDYLGLNVNFGYAFEPHS